MKKTLLIISLVLLTKTVAQENRELITDRPDQTESASTVPKGTIQLETGFEYEKIKSENITENNTVYNTMLIRWGLFDNFELRLGWDIEKNKIEQNLNQNTTLSGLQPLDLGFKVVLNKEEGIIPNIGFLAATSLPFTASKDYSHQKTNLYARLAFEHTLSQNFDLGYNLVIDYQDNDINSNTSYFYTISLGYDILSNIGVFAELYGNIAKSVHSEHLWDAGFTFLLAPNFQWDVSGGSGIKSDQKYFISTGFSWRIPK